MITTASIAGFLLGFYVSIGFVLGVGHAFLSVLGNEPSGLLVSLTLPITWPAWLYLRSKS